FFFSSRRRHTRFSRDWSSDVCSSDLRAGIGGTGVLSGRVRADTGGEQRAQNERGQQVTGHHGDAFLLSRVLVVVDDRGEVGDDGPPVGAGGPFAYSG